MEKKKKSIIKCWKGNTCMENIEVLILGSDANAYYMARCAYEAYHKKAHLIGKERLAFTKFSNILTIEYQSCLWDEEKCIHCVNQYANAHHDSAILLISTNETYSLFLARNKKKLASNLYYFKQDEKVLASLTNKELFYKTYKKSVLSFPETYYFDTTKSTILPTMNFPMIVKPANVVMYNHLSFEGKKKIYKIDTEQELKEVIHTITESGYKDRLILQEYIPGDDSYLFDSVVYVDTKGKVKVISFAEIGIQERTKSMVGNAAALINGFNAFDGNVEQMKKDIITFMETLQMNGFFEFDLKYDARSKTFKVLEINARQGRSSYYLTPLGANLVEVMVDDLILQKSLVKKDLKEKLLLSFVPKGIIKKYVTNEFFQKEALSLWRTQRVSPMECPLDRNFKRFLMMKKRLWHYYKEYKNSDWQS